MNRSTFLVLSVLLALLAPATAASADEPSTPTVSGPHVRPAQRVAAPGPACGQAVAQHREYGAARDLLVDVLADCRVVVTFAADVPAGGSLSLAIDTDSDGGTGITSPPGADRMLTATADGATLTLADPAADPVTPQPTVHASPGMTVVDTTVSALGLRPGRAARLLFGDFASYDLTVDFGEVASSTETTTTSAPARPALKGRAKVGRTLSCVAPKGTKRPTYRWLRDGRAIHGATRRTLRLTKAHAGAKVSCRVAGKTSPRVIVAR